MKEMDKPNESTNPDEVLKRMLSTPPPPPKKEPKPKPKKPAK